MIKLLLKCLHWTGPSPSSILWLTFQGYQQFYKKISDSQVPWQNVWSPLWENISCFGFVQTRDGGHHLNIQHQCSCSKKAMLNFQTLYSCFTLQKERNFINPFYPIPLGYDGPKIVLLLLNLAQPKISTYKCFELHQDLISLQKDV